MALNIVKTKYGQVQGVVEDNITIFRGVPYAQPPVGDLRWRPPQPPKPWDGIRSCIEFAPAAMQHYNSDPKSFYGKEFPVWDGLTFSEDCLYLNIWTPAQSAGEKLPVMMWVHGGGNMSGYSYEPEFDGKALASRGVIYVSVGFRLNIFGFLAHPELTAESTYGGSGNYGHLDQLAAARWIQENIEAFGGDPANITMFGQSGGAHDVQIMATSPLFAGVIDKGISESGGGGASMMGAVPLAEGETAGLEFQQAASCHSIQELRALPADKILDVAGKMGFGLMKIGTVIDQYVCFGDTSEMIRSGKARDIPMIIGCCSHEGGRMSMLPPGHKQDLALFNQQLERNFPLAADKMRQIYRLATEEDADAFDRDLMADGMVYGYQLWARSQNKAGKQAPYVYYFDHPLPDADGNPSPEGAFHSAELWYVHGTLGRCWRKMGKTDVMISEAMMDYWTNFAKTGNPNGQNVPAWEPYTCANPQIMVFGDTVGMQTMDDHPAVKVFSD
ncbi:MAG TPA: carboxylesterase family protein [Candidatus Faecivivens stercorigallinarum]|nr:carboxylesterase family protein [Candidatus Faecivivens stercorigallinarum]